MHPEIYNQVLAWVPPKARVLDLGSGNGEFLQRLIQERQAVGEGVQKAGNGVKKRTKKVVRGVKEAVTPDS